jgi:phage shock protein E
MTLPSAFPCMTRSVPTVLAPVVLAVLILVIAACGGGTGATTPVRQADAATAVGMLGTRVVIDVRTAQEFAAGHIAGARNMDVEGPDFDSQIASLDEGGAYLVYCRSGRRSAMAADLMAEAGFTDIVDGGAMQSLVDAGAPLE